MAERKAKADAVPDYRRPNLAEDNSGTLVATWPVRRHRFLLSDGRTVDVLTPRDDSDLRGELLAHLGVERIEGVVVVDDR